jgi:hypothetical protein
MGCGRIGVETSGRVLQVPFSVSRGVHTRLSSVLNRAGSQSLPRSRFSFSHFQGPAAIRVNKPVHSQNKGHDLKRKQMQKAHHLLTLVTSQTILQEPAPAPQGPIANWWAGPGQFFQVINEPTQCHLQFVQSGSPHPMSTLTTSIPTPLRLSQMQHPNHPDDMPSSSPRFPNSQTIPLKPKLPAPSRDTAAPDY